jgi:hypothetical protein
VANGPVGTPARLYKLVFPRKEPVIMFGFLGTWQFSS